MTLLIFSANLEDTLDNCGKFEGKAVQFWAYLHRDGAEEVYDRNKARKMSNGAHIYLVT